MSINLQNGLTLRDGSPSALACTAISDGWYSAMWTMNKVNN